MGLKGLNTHSRYMKEHEKKCSLYAVRVRAHTVYDITAHIKFKCV